MTQYEVDLDFMKICSSLLTVGARSSLLLTVAHCLWGIDNILHFFEEMMTILN